MVHYTKVDAMNDEIEHDSEFELDDYSSPHYAYDEDYYDEDERDYYFSDFDEWDGPDVYYCEICGEDESEGHESHAHALHENAERDLKSLLVSYPCRIDGEPLEFHAYCPPDECVTDEYALAVCHVCGETYTILHTKNRTQIIDVYLGIGGYFDGVWDDNQPVDVEPVEPPF
jgi:hypothetical protein